MLHQEPDGIAASAATKTFIDLLGGRDGKGRCLFVVERAKTQVVNPSFLELYKAANDIDNVDTALDLLYGLLRYHRNRQI